MRLTQKRLRRNIGLHEIVQRSRQTTMYFHSFFSLDTKRKSFNTKKNFLLGMNKIRKTPAGLERSTVSPQEFVVVDDDNVCTAPIWADKDILEFVQSSKNMEADSKD
ncbi:hypothetical protein TNCV_3627191 [Trichonephila clavipes]|nr:hypothetical protein TNCV_3627191 [Trichonephila clavipes]